MHRSSFLTIFAFREDKIADILSCLTFEIPQTFGSKNIYFFNSNKYEKIFKKWIHAPYNRHFLFEHFCTE